MVFYFKSKNNQGFNLDREIILTLVLQRTKRSNFGREEYLKKTGVAIV
jgi:hypothetical protein